MLIFGLFCPCARSNLLTASFILVRSETALLQIYNDLLLASGHRPVTALVLLDLSSTLTPLTIKFCLIDLLPSMVSQVPLSLYFDPIFLIVLIPDFFKPHFHFISLLYTALV